jgi:hypothetical protein
MSGLPTLSIHRHRGAQPYNTNALNHGGYTRSRSQEPPTPISEAQMGCLRAEIVRLKNYMSDLYNKNIDSNDSAVIAETLHALSLAALALSRALAEQNHFRVLEPDAPHNPEEYLRSMLESLDIPL